MIYRCGWFISSRGEVNIVEDIGVGVYTVATWIGLAFPSRECFVYGFIDVGSTRQYFVRAFDRRGGRLCELVELIHGRCHC